MSLADERRAIAQGMAASRAATGADERRAIGQRLVNERRGIKEDLNALEKSPRKNAQLPQLERRGTRVPAVEWGVGTRIGCQRQVAALPARWWSRPAPASCTTLRRLCRSMGCWRSGCGA